MEKANKKEKVERYNDAFPSRLRVLMNNPKNPVSRQKLAEVLGVTPQQVSNYTVGTSLPDFNCIYKLANFFNVSADYLLGLSDITSSNADIKKINQTLGLSEKSIERLKSDVDFVRQIGTHILEIENIESTEMLLQVYNQRFRMMDVSVINLLLEEPYHGEEDILTLLGDVFTHQHADDPNAVFTLSQSVLDSDKDEYVQKVIPNTTLLTDADILAVRLLKLQQAVARYKKELDENRTNGDK